MQAAFKRLFIQISQFLKIQPYQTNDRLNKSNEAIVQSIKKQLTTAQESAKENELKIIDLNRQLDKQLDQNRELQKVYTESPA